MILVVCALNWEAQPLIQHWQLKKWGTWGSIQVFADANRQKMVAVCGIGKLNASLAASLLFQTFAPEVCTHPAVPPAVPVILANFGFAGAKPQGPFSKGELVQAYQIHDQASQRNYYLDLPLRNGLPLVKCVCVEQPQTTALSVAEMPLADMESAGVAHSAFHFLTPAQMVILKVVSDYFQSACLSPQISAQLMIPQVPKIAEVFEAYHHWHLQQWQQQHIHALKPQEELCLQHISTGLKLTVTQQHHLKKMSKSYKSRAKLSGLEVATMLRPFEQITIQHKHQQAYELARITQLLEQ